VNSKKVDTKFRVTHEINGVELKVVVFASSAEAAAFYVGWQISPDVSVKFKSVEEVKHG